MAGFLPITLPRHRLAVAGKVTDAVTARPIEGARAAISSGPAAFQERVAIARARSGAAWDALAARVDRAVTEADGFFGFADLPDGAYTVVVSAPAALWYAPATLAITVKRDASGNIAARVAPVSLAPSGLRGSVVAQDTQSGMSLARVRVEDSGEAAHCDATGAFLLLGVQPGSRRLSIAASGYRRGAAPASVTLGQITDLGVLSLQPAGA